MTSIRKIIFFAVLVILILYTVWTIIFGKNGFTTLRLFSSKKEELVKERESLEESKATLAKKVGRLRSNSLDLDNLDENARKNLGYAQEGEKIYLDN